MIADCRELEWVQFSEALSTENLQCSSEKQTRRFLRAPETGELLQHLKRFISPLHLHLDHFLHPSILHLSSAPLITFIFHSSFHLFQGASLCFFPSFYSHLPSFTLPSSPAHHPFLSFSFRAFLLSITSPSSSFSFHHFFFSFFSPLSLSLSFITFSTPLFSHISFLLSLFS